MSSTTLQTEDRLPVALEACGSLMDSNGYVNQRVDLKLRAGTGWAHHQSSEFFLKVWWDRAFGIYRAEVWSCRRYQETLCSTDFHALLEEAAHRWDGGAD